MKRFTKITLIVSLCLILVGIGLTGCGIMLGGIPNFIYNPSTHQTIRVESKSTPVTKKLDAFTNINCKLNDTDLVIKQGDDYSITYPKNTFSSYPIEVSDDTLTINESTANKSGKYFNFTIHDMLTETPQSIVITVPKDCDLSSIQLSSDSGDITLSDIISAELNISADYGDATLTSVQIPDLECNLKDGDLALHNCDIQTANFSLSYGDCDITNSSVQKICCTSDDGDFLADRSDFDSFTVTLSYGNLDIDDSSIEKLTADISSGDCDITLNGKAKDYSMDLTSSYGDITVSGHNNESGNYQTAGLGSQTIQITNSYGDIDISFTK